MRPKSTWLTTAVVCLAAAWMATLPAAAQPLQPTDPVWERTGGPLGGLGYDIRFNFTQTNEWYVTDAYAGFHLSTDDGLTWRVSNKDIDTRTLGGIIPVFSATVDPHDDANIIWIGMQNSGDIFKSSNRGRSWTKKNNGIESDPYRKASYSFRGFTIDPRTSDIVYAMAEIGSAGWTPDGSERKGLENDMTMGVVYKTIDGGEHWTEIWRGDNLARYCWINPVDPDILYISTGIFDREAANTEKDAGFAGGVGILKSANGGNTWTRLNQANGLGDLFVSSLFMHPQDPDILLAAAAQNNWSGHDPGNFTGGVYRTTNGGVMWTRVLAKIELFSAVEFCVSNPNVAYAGSRQAIYRSDDGGLTWPSRYGRTDGTWGSPGVIAGFPIDIQCDPVDPMRVYVNNYLGGNFLSTDGGATWASVSKGYTGAQVRSLAVVGADEVYAGGRSGVFRSTDEGDSWTGLANPGSELQGAAMNEVMALAAHPKRPSRVVASFSDIGGVLWTDNAGQSWALGVGIVIPPRLLVSDPSHMRRFYAVVSPYKGKSVVGTDPTQGIYVTNDSGKTWSQLSSQAVTASVLSTMTIDPHNSDVLYAADFKGGHSTLLKSVDRGRTWSIVGDGLPDLPVSSLAINPAMPNVVFAGMAEASVYRSLDGGLSFTASASGLDPEGVITSVRVHPKWAGDPTKSRVFAADLRRGVFVSSDAGTTWSALTDGMEFTAVNAMEIAPDGSMIYAGIEGGGVYRMKWR